MNQIIKIGNTRKRYDLSKPKEAVDFLLLILSEDNFSINSYSIIKHTQGLSLSEYVSKLKNSENPCLRCDLDIGELLKIYSNANNNINVLYQYLMDDSIGDKIKEQKLQNILKGLSVYIDWLWEYDCVSTVSYHMEQGVSEFNKKLKTYPELYAFLPSYFIYLNLKTVYDLIWDRFKIFIDKNENPFQYKYSHKEHKQNLTGVPDKKSFVKPKAIRSRSEIFNDLIDGVKNEELFHEFEEKLIHYRYLSKDKNRWERKASNFLRFYAYCEDRKLFKYYKNDSTKGVKLLRELYQFYEGTTMDKKSKRKLQLTPKTKYEFIFLNGIN